jgi:hypothetical protein
MTPEARAAHLRLSTTLPSRRHEWQCGETRVEWGHKRTPSQREAMAKELKEMQAAGMTRKQMRDASGCTYRTIGRLLAGPQ